MDIFTGTVIGTIGFVVLALVGFAFLISRFLRTVEPGKAMIIVNPFKGEEGMRVTFTGGFVFPIIHRCETMDISTKRITVERRGNDGLSCKDNIRADISVNFYVRVNNTEEDVKNVAQSIGVQRAAMPDTLNDLFQAKFSEALKTVGKQMDFEALFQDRAGFKDRIIKTIGANLNGYSLEDTAIGYLEQTPLEQLDPNNIMDSEGIKKINEVTLTQREIKVKRDTEAAERILEMDKQKAEATAKQQAEVQIIQAREQAEAVKIQEEERVKATMAQIKADEQLEVAKANQQREVEIAQKNKERAVAVEEERVTRDRMLEITEREKLVALAQIEKERHVEREKKEIQDIIRQRVAVERTVAEEEERTKDTRALAGAQRDKQVVVLQAEAAAEQKLVVEIKSAEAHERAARHTAKQREIEADAELLTSEKRANAKKKLAEGTIAEAAAGGLATVKVKEADAEAIRKVGEAEATAKQYLINVEAQGIEQKGLAAVKVKKADADATLVSAEADAVSIQRKAQAEAEGKRAGYEADAQGITAKGEAMKAFDNVGRDHEEYKLRLALKEKIAMEELRVRKDLAHANAEVIGKALGQAKIDIVGGDAVFFDKLVQSIGAGKAADAYFQNHGALTEIKDALLQGGEGNLLKRLKTLAKQVGISTEAMKNLSVAGLVARMAASTEDEQLLAQIFSLEEALGRSSLKDQKVAKVIDAA